MIPFIIRKFSTMRCAQLMVSIYLIVYHRNFEGGKKEKGGETACCCMFALKITVLHSKWMMVPQHRYQRDPCLSRFNRVPQSVIAWSCFAD
ncbi:hypothetical protein TWF970_006600 [Orbilia oligospora]|uniref:Uncharacterized protein n=1 Tax=Orbilia oligospora TaxID=2813651 RepID=A0A7C8VL82_ORBOL|nr:hypothetical protein TWF970_006600 [Orbilia oligospora]